MSKTFLTIRRILVAICLFSILVVSINQVYASSEVLLKSIADTKLGNLKQCIESHGNDISICIAEFKEYLRAEIKLIKSSKEKSIYNKRLNKMINYLRQSADIFYEKAENTKKMEYYEKASRCAALLVKLSKKYQSYERMVNQFENSKQSSNSTVLLKILFQKSKEKEYPNTAFQEAFNLLIKKSVPIYSILDRDFQAEIRAYSNQLILEYMKNLRKIVSTLEGFHVPDFNNLNGQFIIYKEAIKIPGVDTHQTESSSLRKKFGMILDTYLNEAKVAQGRATRNFLDGDNKLLESTDRLNSLKEIICISSAYIMKNADDLFLEVPSITDNFLSTLRDTTDFLLTSIQASNQEKAGEYINSAKLWNKALSFRSIDRKLQEKAQNIEFQAIQAAVDQATNLARDLANRNKFEKAFEVLEGLRTSITLNKAQEIIVLSLKQKIKIQGQREILKLAKTLKSEGNHMAALRTINLTKIVGTNNELEEFYNDLKKNFNWGEIETLEDSKYFVNCSFNDLLNYITFPQKAGLDVFCEFTLLFKNQLDTDGYYGYLGGRSDSPVYIRIINPAFKGATLIGKQAYCIFRINGIEALKNVLTDSTVNVPNLEVIYLQ
jgi:hypothetical protein